MESPLLDALAERVLVYDGAMGTQIQGAALANRDFTLVPQPHYSQKVREAAERVGDKPLDGCNEILVLTRPDVVENIHGAYLEVGADLIETNTFGATSIVLAEYGISELVYDISLEAARCARRAADRYTTAAKPRFVVGAIGPGTKLVSLGQTTWQELEDTYADGFRGLLEGGSDALLLETLQDLLMVKATIVAAERAMAETGRQVPLFVQVTMEQTGTMLLGSEMAAALNMIEAFPSVKAFGLNCATGPVEMTSHIRFLGQNSTRPLAVQPNAGLPVMEAGQARYKLTPEELAEHHVRFVTEHGVALAGGCCGTTPAHIKAVAEAVGGRSHTADCHWRRVRHLFPGFDFTMKTDDQASALSLVGCSSLYTFQPYEQDNSFLIVGEKTNANGSRAFRDLLAAENWEGLTELARELEGEGSHVLDVCTAYVGRDEKRDMTTLLSYYNRHITVPLMIDSTEVPVVEAALKCLAGKPIVNSINFEDGESRTEKVLGLCRKYGAAVVALTIDEDGMAKSAEKKVEVAERLLARTRAAGLPDHDVFLDCLTFTLGSGDEEFRESAVATLDAIEEIRKRHPGVNTILGVSNVSFGLKPALRQILNSAFLHYAREVGLTSAIVHFSKIRPEHQIEADVWQIASDLVFDRRRYAA
ncbi:homocysteine S-methyltransferase family protein [Fimbriimonas ginsengisoli]|uniref:Methionine synthase n=1 Tax=Fimbriimonas ginsengisoli Gsoil 348 TaxID=661478 RepID=A0A068NYI2_FIMGI|nr:homocysteine S-methyltransferase family protein [Fimbriimonas ginsengisoli]AIE88165.1 methionine synthase [Fimbriimonas ginsengisoli Gsoil 348]